MLFIFKVKSKKSHPKADQPPAEKFKNHNPKLKIRNPQFFYSHLIASNGLTFAALLAGINEAR